jgi:spermidine/putrescine transport system permease protein
LSASVAAEAPTVATGRGRLPEPRKRRRWTTFVLPTYTGLVLVYLVLPIVIVILYSFNQSNAALPRVSFAWQGFTFRWYRELFQIPGLTPAFFLSLRLAAVSTVLSAVLGTLVALALVRHRFRGKGAMEQIMFLNIAAPEIVLGASLLGFFITLGLPRGFFTLLIAHVAFSIAYVSITVRARLAGFDRSIEEAAQDLGADPWVTFRKITLPIIFPGVLAGALMAFALSIDDYVISSFVTGSQETFPIWVFGASRVGIPPQVFVFGTIIFMAGVSLALTSLILQTRKR